MIEIRSRSRAKDRTYTHGVYYGTIGGAALGNDAAPTNLASVTAARRLRAFATKEGVTIVGAAAIQVIVNNSTGANGTTAVFRGWYYDNFQGLWIPHGTILTYTVATSFALSNNVVALTTTSFGFKQGALVFVQVVSNTALVDSISYDVN